MITVFDFDKTLTYKDTLLGFYKQCNSEKKYTYLLLRSVYFVFQVLNKLKICSNLTLKKIGVNLFLVGKSKAEIEKKSHVYASLISLNDTYKKYFTMTSENINERIILSASFEEYINPIFNEGIRVYGSKLRYNDQDRVNGIDRNLYGVQKRIFFEQELKKKLIDNLFTDSYSDLPLAIIAKNIYLIKGIKEIRCNSINHFKKLSKSQLIKF